MFQTPFNIIILWSFLRTITFDLSKLQLGIALGIYFLIAWSPYTLVNMWAAFGNPLHVPETLNTLAPLTGKSAAVVNPLLVVGISQKFRSYLKMMIRCKSPEGEGHIEDEMQDFKIW